MFCLDSSTMKLCHNLQLWYIITLSGIRTITKRWDSSSMAYLVKANTKSTFLHAEISLYSPFWVLLLFPSICMSPFTLIHEAPETMALKMLKMLGVRNDENAMQPFMQKWLHLSRMQYWWSGSSFSFWWMLSVLKLPQSQNTLFKLYMVFFLCLKDLKIEF